ncbi:Mitotic spindle assembly checkpoint protein MAD1 [Manis javanica]|nr:Mitotic spindle assembly checkpoint protein MAD1 [Manis javanica]
MEVTVAEYPDSTLELLPHLITEGPAVTPAFTPCEATGPAGAKMQLLETEFSGAVRELIELHLLRQDSIPAFLSALTLDLFSRQTVA